MVALIAKPNAPQLARSPLPLPLISIPFLKRLSTNSTNAATLSHVTQVSGTSDKSIIACNSISIVACLITLSLYLILSFNRKYKRLMRRTSLVLAASMASSDLVLHCGNLVGYGPLPSGFACGFIGGWLFAAPSLLSIFYSCCIALNSQLVFILHRRPSPRALPYYIIIPMTITFIITFAALGTKSFGYDQTWGYCWYSTENVAPSLVLIRILLTYSLPTLIGILYLIIATITISLAVFGRFPLFKKPSNPVLARMAGSRDENAQEQDIRLESQSPVPRNTTSSSLDKSRMSPGIYTPSSPIPYHDSPSSDIHTFPPAPTATTPASFGNLHALPTIFEKSNDGLTRPAYKRATSTEDQPLSRKGRLSAETQPNTHVRVERRGQKSSRKAAVLRQLTVRLIGYIVCPILCLLPGIILDLITKAWPDMHVPTGLNGTFDGLNGLIGLFNSLLMLSDPALLAVWEDLSTTVESRETCWIGKIKLGLRMLLKGEVLERELEKREREERDDSLASNFGVGARTRMDEVNDEGEDQAEGKTNPQERRGSVRSYRLEARRRSDAGVAAVVEELPTETKAEGWSTEWGTGEVEVGKHAERELEIQVRVDVTRRISRVELMEDWLAGL